MTSHLSTLTLHRLRYGELEGLSLAEAEAHLGACDRCNARLTVQEQDRAAFVFRPVPAAIREIAAAEAPRRSVWRDLFPFLLAAAAALVLFVSVPMVRTAGDGDRIATRGTLPAVEAWIDQGGGPRPLREADVLDAGDRVQLTYDPRGASYVAIAGRDGTGAVEVYTTTAPTGVGLVRAPFALTLDGAPGVQELFVVGSDDPLDEREVKAAVLGDVSRAHVARISIRKRETHR